MKKDARAELPRGRIATGLRQLAVMAGRGMSLRDVVDGTLLLVGAQQLGYITDEAIDAGLFLAIDSQQGYIDFLTDMATRIEDAT